VDFFFGPLTPSCRFVAVTSEAPGVVVREHCQVEDDTFTYRLDVSNDDGKSWNEGQVEMTFRRSK
jgi:hypothetical protein